MGTVSRLGSTWVEMKAREVKIVAAHRRVSLAAVSKMTIVECCQTV